MNRWILAILAVFLLVSTVGAQQYSACPDSVSLGAAITSSGAYVSKPVSITQIIITTDGTNAVTVQPYNNTAGSGEALAPMTCPAGTTTCVMDWKFPRYCSKGLYLTITTAGTASVAVEGIPRY